MQHPCSFRVQLSSLCAGVLIISSWKYPSPPKKSLQGIPREKLILYTSDKFTDIPELVFIWSFLLPPHQKQFTQNLYILTSLEFVTEEIFKFKGATNRVI